MTPAQIITLRAACFADGTAAAFFPPRDNAGLLAYLNSASTFVAWKSSETSANIMDAIIWDRLTPTDAADGDPTAMQREYRCQGKQLNLQIMLQGRDIIPCGKANIRNGLSDALAAVPSGISGAVQDAGWLGAGKVKAVISRVVTIAEKVFCTGAGTAGTPGNLGAIDGLLTQSDVDTLMFKSDGSTWTAGG